MMRTLMAGLIAATALAAQAQFPENATRQLETQAIGAAGGRSANATRQIQCIIGQPTPLVAEGVTQSSATRRIQPGQIPQLYPRTRLGDSNNDTIVDAADIVTSNLIGRAQLPSPTNVIRRFNADVNTDGRLTLADMTALATLILTR